MRTISAFFATIDPCFAVMAINLAPIFRMLGNKAISSSLSPDY
jgi:hypothetical protein